MGLGNVGSGVANALLSQMDFLSVRVNRSLNLRKVLVRDPSKHSNSQVPPQLLTTNPEDILDDPDIHIIVELIGGTEPTTAYLEHAVTAGKHVVTANKEVMSKNGPDLLALARRKQVRLLFEASVGGGIPIVGSLMNQLVANEIQSIRSIINGTTNYILTQMAYHRAGFQQALTEAQAQGYAEADPTNDVEGFDAAYKLSILASLGFHRRIGPDDVYRQGISQLHPKDFQYAEELGYAIKFLAIATQNNGDIQARVYPAFIPRDHMLAKVDGVYNAVEITGHLCGQVLFHGQGAGREATTSAVMGDVMEIARNLGQPTPQVPVLPPETHGSIRAIGDLKCKYYLRLNVADQPGVLAEIANILGKGGISLASVLQKDADAAAQTAEIVITTHPAREASLQQALGLVSSLDVVQEVNSMLRIEE